jgi:hypothetical protein
MAANGGGYDTQVYYGTRDELNAIGMNLCNGTTTVGKTVTGTATGLTPPFDIGYITLGASQDQLTAGATMFTLTNVLDGPLDFVASRNAGTFTGASVTFVPNSFIIERNLNPANNAVIGPYNFNAGITPATAQLTFANTGADWTGSIGSYFTPRNTFALLYTDVGLAAVATRPWYGFPAASRQAGELHVVSAIAIRQAGGIATQTRQVMFAQADVANKTVTFGPDLTNNAITVLGTAPYLRLSIANAVQAEYNGYFVGNFQQGTGATFRSVTIQKSMGWISGGGTAALEIEDWSAANGTYNTYALMPAVQTTVTQTATGWTGVGNFFMTPYVEGAMFFSATRLAQLTP